MRLPLTERVLARLPGPRWLWVLIWAAGGFSRPAFLMEAFNLVGEAAVSWDFVTRRLVPTFVFAYLVIASLWMVARATQDLAAVEPTLSRLTKGDDTHAPEKLVRGIASVTGPMILTALLTLVVEINIAAQHGVRFAALILPVVAVTNVPFMVALWVYIALLVGLDRLGRLRLALDPFPEDRSLGLRPIGRLAFSAFWRFSAAAVPFLLLSFDDRLDLVLGAIIFGVGVAVLFLSVNRLHHQMVAAKREYVAWARGFYTRAVEPLRSVSTLEALQKQAPLMSAAEVLERRAEAILEWPFDERTAARIVAVVTAVFTAFVSRLILKPLGL